MSDQELVDKFNNNEDKHNILMEKIDQLVNVVNDVKVSIAALPQIILSSADVRYASKESEKRLNALETRIESRSYDWLKYAIVTFIGILLAIVSAYKLKV
jgi:hypothetical protein